MAWLALGVSVVAVVLSLVLYDLTLTTISDKIQKANLQIRRERHRERSNLANDIRDLRRDLNSMKDPAAESPHLEGVRAALKMFQGELREVRQSISQVRDDLPGESPVASLDELKQDIGFLASALEMYQESGTDYRKPWGVGIYRVTNDRPMKQAVAEAEAVLGLEHGSIDAFKEVGLFFVGTYNEEWLPEELPGAELIGFRQRVHKIREGASEYTGDSVAGWMREGAPEDV